MAEATVLWAGKHLTDAEELRIRRLAALMRRCDEHASAEHFERFLPEGLARWTPDELELGAHMGPWMNAAARIDDPAE